MTTPDRNETVVKTDSRIHSATETQHRYTLHVPKNDNAGRVFGDATFLAVSRALVSMFGAFTRTDAFGVWQSDDGNIYEDSQWLYHIDTASDMDGVQLRTFAAGLREMLEQECVYVTRQSIDTWLV